jgi:two-component system, OmpR family, phosphate regulon sensor histidine kinase PhoR
MVQVVKIYTSLRFVLTSAVFAGLWALERRTHEQAAAALLELQSRADTLANENARLIRRDQLKSNFIADAAHELRSPIANLKIRLYLLENASHERRSEYMADLKFQLERLNRLSEDLLAISRIDAAASAHRFTSVDFNHVAEEVIIAFRPTAESAGLSLETHYTSPLPMVMGNHGQLVQVGSNLVANAIHYTPSGHVTVSTLLNAVRKQVCIQVEDSGIGIPPDDLPRLFDRFYRGRYSSSTAGTGLGLSIVKEIVELHGGSIDVETEVGRGSRFRVCLPLAGERADDRV